jgi:hypothetical protein
LKQIGVPKAKNSQTAGFELPSPLRVASYLIVPRMSTAVELNDQFLVGAVEIDHICTYRMLPAELGAGKTPASKLKPQPSFWIGRTATQDASPVQIVAVQGRLRTH